MGPHDEHGGHAYDKPAHTRRARMALEDRAKIFSPFDPLTGFREALREKEREVEAAEGDRPWAEPRSS